MKRLLLSILTITIFVLSSCKTSQLATTPQVVNGSYAAQEKALLWEITGNKIKKPSYLYGTIHMIPKDDFFLLESTKERFAKAKKVVFEINMAEVDQMELAMKMMTMMFMEDKTLKDLLSEEDYTKVKEALKENPMIEMMGESVERIKPIFLSTMLDQGEMGMDPMGGGGLGGNLGDMKSYEFVLLEMAQEAEKEMGGLETVEFQMSIFDKIPLEEQAQMLVQAIDMEKEEGEDVLSIMVKMYKDQDVPAMYQIIHEQSGGSNSEFEKELLTERNKNWIPQMKEMMKKEPTFFAVGAGHLGGELGVISLLRQEGYIVTPVLD